ncbi:MAG: exodeoxyribonuclease III [Neisseriaceae bacterium]|nr:MAG: exodeoxyribonuclease III [Neisseriaceae bacterium]
MKKIITANVNGIRSATKKGIWDYLEQEDPDVICFQELKVQEQDLSENDKNPLHMHRIWHCAEKRGYSGVAIYSKSEPNQVQIGIGNELFDREGRYIRADYDHFSIVSLYLPSGTSSEERQDFKYVFLDYLQDILQGVIKNNESMLICGDWNIAHQNIDLKNWKANQKNSGFLPEEREWLSKIFKMGWVDIWRTLYPDIPGYTWWSNRGQAYAKDVGWRIDYQITTPDVATVARNASIYKGVKFSDHAPLSINYLLD